MSEADIPRSIEAKKPRMRVALLEIDPLHVARIMLPDPNDPLYKGSDWERGNEAWSKKLGVTVRFEE